MSKIDSSKSLFQQLKGLHEEPDEQASVAVAMLEMDLNQQELLAAAQVLAEKPDPGARPRLVDLFYEFSKDGEVIDPGGELRSWIIRALQPVAKPVDSALFETAALTYEYLPPGFEEQAGSLRLAGVGALAHIDDELAAFHASRLLVEKSTDPMSGEPAVTAARILSRLDRLVPLYQYLYHDRQDTLPEIVSECLGLLTSISVSLVPGLIDRFSASDNDLILAGLFDLLLGHDAGLQDEDYLISFLKDTKRYDAYRYLIAMIIAERRQDLLPTALPVLRFERDKEKVFILLDAFEPMKTDPEISAAVEQLRRNIQ